VLRRSEVAGCVTFDAVADMGIAYACRGADTSSERAIVREELSSPIRVGRHASHNRPLGGTGAGHYG
jgi:hypothetical protein